MAKYNRKWANKSGTPTYYSWKNMLKRCLEPHNKHYEYYGGRGITVCDEWLSYDKFFADMGEKPDGRTLERIDNNGNYTPQNCRWATREEQDSNKRTNRHITYRGKTQTMEQWARELRIHPATLSNRINARGMRPEIALSIPVDSRYSRRKGSKQCQ